jgi:hypothetical protein
MQSRNNGSRVSRSRTYIFDGHFTTLHGAGFSQSLVYIGSRLLVFLQHGGYQEVSFVYRRPRPRRKKKKKERKKKTEREKDAGGSPIRRFNLSEKAG